MFPVLPPEAPTWIQTEAPKQKRGRRESGGSGTAMASSTARELPGATRTEAARRGRAASDDTMTPRTLNTTTVSHQKNAGEQNTPMAAETIYCPPTTPHPQTVQLTAILTDTQVLQLSPNRRHPRRWNKCLNTYMLILFCRKRLQPSQRRLPRILQWLETLTVSGRPLFLFTDYHSMQSVLINNRNSHERCKHFSSSLSFQTHQHHFNNSRGMTSTTFYVVLLHRKYIVFLPQLKCFKCSQIFFF